MEQSNITRDHLAMEAMRTLIAVTTKEKRTIWNRIKCALSAKVKYRNDYDVLKEHFIARQAYSYADAMIAERNRKPDAGEKD